MIQVLQYYQYTNISLYNTIYISILKRLFTILSLILITSVAYSQQDIVMTVDDVLEKEMVGMDKVFYIIVDSTLYPLPHIKDDKYRIPKTIIDRISEVDTFYFYLETNKGYYWYSENGKDLYSYNGDFFIQEIRFLGKGVFRDVLRFKYFSIVVKRHPSFYQSYYHITRLGRLHYQKK